MPHRVIVVVVSCRGSVVAEQGRDFPCAVGSIGQQANALFIRLVLHHVRGGDVAVVAAEAQENSANFLASALNTAGQNFRVRAAVTKVNGLAIQWAGVLAPQCIAAGIGGAGVAGTERATVRSMAARAASASVIVRAEDVNRR